MLDFITDSAVAARLTDTDVALLQSLLATQLLDQGQADRAAAAALRLDVPLSDILLRDCNLPSRTIARYLAKAHGAQVVDLTRRPADATLIARWGARDCLRRGVLPWRAA